MVRFLSKHVLDIVFLVLVVAAALTIFLLSRADQEAAAPSEESAAVSAEPVAATADKKQTASFRGVPEDVFLTHLRSAEAYDAEPDGLRKWTISFGESPFLTARLTYELDNCNISSVVLRFPLPQQTKSKKGSAIDKSVADSIKEFSLAQADAIRTLLADLLPACDLDSTLTESEARAWAEDAIAVREEDKTYHDEKAGCQFLAYRSEENDAYVLYMALHLDS